MSTTDINFFSDPHPSLLESDIKIGDIVQYLGDGFHPEATFKVDSYDKRNNGDIIVLAWCYNDNGYCEHHINFSASIKMFKKSDPEE